MPSFQSGANIPSSVNPGHRIGRGVPDVAGLADYITGMIIADSLALKKVLDPDKGWFNIPEAVTQS